MIYGQPITFGGKSEPKLLWTNASPTSSFAAQTVYLPTGYDGYLIEIAARTIETDRRLIGFCTVGGVATIAPSARDFPSSVASYANFSGRSVRANSASVEFSQGFYVGPTSGYNAIYGIPTRIWGVKFTL